MHDPFRPEASRKPTWARFGAENGPRNNFHRCWCRFWSILEGFCIIRRGCSTILHGCLLDLEWCETGSSTIKNINFGMLPYQMYRSNKWHWDQHSITRITIIIEFGSPSGAASNLGLTIVTSLWPTSVIIIMMAEIFFIIIMATISL